MKHAFPRRVKQRLSLCVLAFLLPFAGSANHSHFVSAGEGADPLAAAVDAVLVAHAEGLGSKLAQLAAKSEPDPWLVAECLCARSADAARAFAGAAGGPDQDGLAAYVEKRSTAAPSQEQIAQLMTAGSGRRARDWVALSKGPRGGGEDVASITLAIARGTGLRRTGNSAAARDALLPAARAALAFGWLRAARTAFFQAAIAAHEVSDYRSMLAAFSEMSTLEHQSGQLARAAQALLFLGNVYTELGQYAQAMAHFGRAEAMLEKVQIRHGLTARILNAMATARRLAGEYGRALVLTERGLELAELDRDRMDLLSNLAQIRGALGEHDAAVLAFEDALALARKSEPPARIAIFVGNVGQAKMRAGDHEGAQAALDEAHATFVRVNHAPSIATALTNLGYLALQRGRHAEALIRCERAVEVAKGVENPFLLASTQQNVGECLLALGRHTDAIEHFTENVELADLLGARSLVVEGQLGLVQCHLAKGDANAALAAARKGIAQLGAIVGGLAEGQGAEARAQHARLFELAAEAATRLDDPAALAYVFESGRAMALLESLEGRDELRAVAIPPAHRAEESEARAALAEARTIYQRARRTGNLKKARKHRKTLRSATARLEAVIQRIRREAKNEAALVYPTPDDLETLQAHLRPHDALVLYGLTESGYVALVSSRQSSRVVKLGERAVCDAACEAVVEATSESSTQAETELGALRKLIVDPLKLDAKIRRVLVSPVGSLFLVPIPALLPKREVAYTPSGTTYGVLRSLPAHASRDVLAFGAVDYSSNPRLSDLASSREEAMAVGSEVVLGADATESAVRTRLAKKPHWRALHFACHGLLDLERPMQSALALGRSPSDDGRLTVVEIFTAKVPADLVTLSACESGRGRIYEAEGILGMTRAFMYAGAPRVLCSLWKVDDAATQALMVKFYELWNPKQGKGKRAAQALAEAQAYVRTHAKWKAPHYWAAWVLWGLPD